MKKLLTKSNYLIGLKCNRSLWITKNKPELLPEIDLSTQHRFDTGNKVGEVAKQYFKDGIDIPSGDFKESLRLSKEYIKKREILFEVGFIHERCYSRADVLKPVGKDEWDIIEVKSGTKVKPENLSDVAFQKYVYENNGLKIRNCYLMYINNEYVKSGDLDINELFTLEKINDEVKDNMTGIQNNIDFMLKVMDFKEYDEKKFGKHCINPKECPLPELDWGFLPKPSVFNLYNIRVKKAMEYYNLGYVDLKQPNYKLKLNEKQQIQVDCEKDGKCNIEPVGIKSFLQTLKYPLYYIDFETYNPAIPLYNNVKPYQRIPFQFSLHIQETPNSKLKHYEFLSAGKQDPIKDFISYMKDWIKDDEGSIIVYNQGFEKGVLKETSKVHKEFKEWVETIDKRFVDLLDVFRNFYYYNPCQNGSCSIKAVLPALYPEKNHKHLDISDGMSASIQYEKSVWEYEDKNKIEKIRENLLEYCKLDTMAMVHIKEELEKLI